MVKLILHICSCYKVYNVSQFVSEHPGGKDQIMLGAGRDITPMFDSYHPLDTHKYVSCGHACMYPCSQALVTRLAWM